MEIKKSPKADLEGKKGVFFEIGLTLALAVLLFAFEWKSSTEQVTPLPKKSRLRRKSFLLLNK